MIEPLNFTQTAQLRGWLDRPNGALSFGIITFEAVEGGGIWVRTSEWKRRGGL